MSLHANRLVTCLNGKINFSFPKTLLTKSRVTAEQRRNVWLIKRQYETHLPKEGRRPMLRSRHYVYDDIIKTESTRRPNVELILTDLVEGIGKKGELVSVRPHVAHNSLLLEGKAVYASPENLEKFGVELPKDGQTVEEVLLKKIASAKTRKALSRQVLSITMNRENPWTVEKFHIRASLRKLGFWASDECIELPEKPIAGPDMELEGKIFLAKITINKTDEVMLRCRIHHWTTNLKDRAAPEPAFWCKEPVPVFPEETELLSKMVRPPLPRKKAFSFS